ncbi:olfactory receptor 6N1-like [Hyla sarda]|uniref:olfactory receptor 6N1-like n=1 Tax=Hyla sarda TaxID=327740 RepID=UPI0024C3B4C5|nr:olfactory receptor 6N1-like [Hyla sarda]
MDENNCSRTTHFIILGFQGIPETFLFNFILFLNVYILTVFSNIVIIVLVKTDSHLHSPMYFFICNLSVLEICYISSTLPNLMSGIVSGNKSISFTGCIIQLYCFSCLGGTENVLLAFMAYDRYLAICNPLKYTMIMSPKMCIQLACLSWSLGIMIAVAAILLVAISCFCGPNVIEHFLCESTPLLQLSCTDVSMATFVLSISTSLLTLSSVLFTMISYCFIIYTVIKIPSTTGKKKALSTCISHFTSVLIFYTSVCIMYVHPSGSNPNRNKAAAVFYAIITPLLNPFVYSLRNKEIKNALVRALKKSKNGIF